MKTTKLDERRVLGRLMATEIPVEKLRGVEGAGPTFGCAGEVTGFGGGGDCKGTPVIVNDRPPI